MIILASEITHWAMISSCKYNVNFLIFYRDFVPVDCYFLFPFMKQINKLDE